MAKRAGMNVKEPIADEWVRGAATYRRLALEMPGAVEASHMGAPDFRIDGKIFATLAYEKKGLGTLKLRLEQQAEFLAEAGQWFQPAPGGWGRMGMTLVKLNAPESVVSGGLETAFQNVIAKEVVKKRASKAKSLHSKL